MKPTNGHLVSPARRHFLAAASATAIKVGAISALTLSAIASDANADKKTKDPKGGKGDKGGQCFLKGTHISTPKGEVRVEDLLIGDVVSVANGDRKTVRWIGHQSYKKSGRHWQRQILPICIRKDAIAEGLPRRDLYLSPFHSLLFDGWLMPVEDLVNGISILAGVPDATDRIEYFHIALDSHQIILAEGVAAESLLIREGEHESFSNFAGWERLGSGRRVMLPCAPMISHSSGRSHLKALARIGISKMVDVRDPIQRVQSRLATRAVSYETAT